MGQVQTGASDLADGIDTLKAGARDLDDGLGQLETGSAALSSGADDLYAGAAALLTGANDLATGAQALAAGVNGDGTEANPGLVGGSKSLYDGLTSLNALVQPSGTEKGVGEKVQGLSDGLATMETVSVGISTAAQNISAALAGDGTAANPGLVAAAKSVADGLSGTANTLPDTVTALSEATASLKAYDTAAVSAASKALTQNLDDAQKAIDNLFNEATATNASIDSANAAQAESGVLAQAKTNADSAANNATAAASAAQAAGSSIDSMVNAAGNAQASAIYASDQIADAQDELAALIANGDIDASAAATLGDLLNGAASSAGEAASYAQGVSDAANAEDGAYANAGSALNLATQAATDASAVSTNVESAKVTLVGINTGKDGSLQSVKESIDAAKGNAKTIEDNLTAANTAVADALTATATVKGVADGLNG